MVVVVEVVEVEVVVVEVGIVKVVVNETDAVDRVVFDVEKSMI